MRKHTTIIRTLAALLVMGLTLVSCTRENEPLSGTFSMSLTATKDYVTMPKALDLNGTTLTASWATGDVVTVWKGEHQLGTLTVQGEGGSVSSLSGDITIPDGVSVSVDDVLTLKFLSPNYNSQEGTIEYIASHCDYAEASVTVTGASSSSISTSDAVFTNQQAIVKFTLQNSVGSALPSNPTALTVYYGTSSVTLSSIIPAATYTTNGDGVLYVAIPGFEDETVTLTATVGDDTYAKTVDEVTFANGQYYTVTAGLKKLSTVTWTSSDISGIYLAPWEESCSTTIKGITAVINGTDESYYWDRSEIIPAVEEGASGTVSFSSSTYTFSKIEITCTQPSNTPIGWSYSDGKLVWNGIPAQSVSMDCENRYYQIFDVTQIDFTVQ